MVEDGTCLQRKSNEKSQTIIYIETEMSNNLVTLNLISKVICISD